MRKSVMEQDIGPHEHEITIYISYEIYAVCKKCGMHDWSSPLDGESYISYFKKKYPQCKEIVRL